MDLNFPHIAPEGFYYETESFLRNINAIWIHHDCEFDYNLGKHVRCIWGFYNYKTKCYHSPINSTKCGNKVDIAHTTPYSAMIIKKTPLESAFV